MKSIIITEKANQVGPIRAAVGDSYGQILSLSGHVMRLKTPEEMREEWAGRWTDALLWPGDIYPTVVSDEPKYRDLFAKVKAAIRGCERVILATDPDRQGQLIGREVLDFLGWDGPTFWARVTAVDPESVRKAFREMRPNSNYDGLYDAGRARQQCDQVANLTMTRSATSILVPPGMKGVIGVGRVKTPTLAILWRRELEIMNFRPETLFSVDADFGFQGMSVTLRCDDLPVSVLKADGSEGEDDDEDAEDVSDAVAGAENTRGKIRDRALADGLAASVRGSSGPLSVESKRAREAPPKLFDMTALQVLAGRRFGFSPERTLEIAQSLYDRHQVLTYPRSERPVLPEADKANVPVLIGALMGVGDYGARFSHLLGQPQTRAIHYTTKELEHYAIVPNASVAKEFPRRLAGLDADERKIFDLVARRYLAAHAPDHEYLRTTMRYAHSWSPSGPAHEWVFRAGGRVSTFEGWREIEGVAAPAAGKAPAPAAGGDPDTGLPRIPDGSVGTIADSRVVSRETKPPSRYTESDVVGLMKSCWRLVSDPQKRKILKNVEGIGTTATRAKIVSNMRKQGQAEVKGGKLVPTAAGMRICEILHKVNPDLLDPVRTAVWEEMLARVEAGTMNMMDVIMRVVKATEVDLVKLRASKGSVEIGKAVKPDEKVLWVAKKVTETTGKSPPPEALKTRSSLLRWIDETRLRDAAGEPVPFPTSAATEKQVAMMRTLAEKIGRQPPREAMESAKAASEWIDAARAEAPPSEPMLRAVAAIERSTGVDAPPEVHASMAACSAWLDKAKGGGRGGSSGSRGGAAGKGGGRPAPRRAATTGARR